MMYCVHTVFIETPDKHQIIIDGGPSPALLEKLAQEMPFWDRTIDLIILTHPEHDHIAGFLEVLKRYEVENILWTGVLRDTAEFDEWQRLIAEEGAVVRIARAGQKITASGAMIEIMHPFEDLSGKEVANTNFTSIVAKLSFGENSFLFTGDIAKSAEKDILEKGADVDADVLKVAHHGSKTSSGEEFIEGVSPEASVISVGKDNKYGHPNLETLDILERYGNILRTDMQGDIKIISSKNTYEISSVQN